MKPNNHLISKTCSICSFKWLKRAGESSLSFTHIHLSGKALISKAESPATECVIHEKRTDFKKA